MALLDQRAGVLYLFSMGSGCSLFFSLFFRSCAVGVEPIHSEEPV